MNYNYPFEQTHQHEHPKLSNIDYEEISPEMGTPTPSDYPSADVEIEMSRSLYDMRRDFKRTTKKLKNLAAHKEPRASIYEFVFTAPSGLRLGMRRAIR